MIAAWRWNVPDRFDIVELNIAASITPIRPFGRRASVATAYDASCGFARPGRSAAMSGYRTLTASGGTNQSSDPSRKRPQHSSDTFRADRSSSTAK